MMISGPAVDYLGLRLYALATDSPLA